MVKVTDNVCNLSENYLFSEVERRIDEFRRQNPGTEIIRMDIGDVTSTVCSAAVRAMRQAADDQSRTDTFHGYGPEQGYEFLRAKIPQ